MTVFLTAFSHILLFFSYLPEIPADLFLGVNFFLNLSSHPNVILAEFKLINAIGTLSAISCIIPLIVGARQYRRLDAPLRLLTINLLIVSCVEIIVVVIAILMTEGFPLHGVREINLSQYLYSAYTPVEYILFILMFSYWQESKTFRKMLKWSIALFLILWLASQLWFYTSGETLERQLQINDFLLPFESLIFIIVSIMTLVIIIRDESKSVLENPVFWVTAGILFYFTGNLFIFTFQSIILAKGSTLMKAWYVHIAMNFLKNILFAVGLYIAGKSVLESVRTADEKN